jgi:hypothetical protein
MAEVQHLFTCLVHRFPMKEENAVEAIENKGLKGCIHGRPDSDRQILLMDRETLDKFELPPGRHQRKCNGDRNGFSDTRNWAAVENRGKFAGNYGAVQSVSADG